MPEDDKQQGSKYNPESLEDAKKIIDSLEKRVGERDATITGLRTELGDYGKRLQAIEEGQKKKLEEEGNWKALAEKRHAEAESLRLAAERATALEAVIRQSNEASIARIPEARRGLIPVDYAPEKLQAWLASNGALLMREPAPEFNQGEGGDGNPPKKIQLTEEHKAFAASAGIPLDVYEKMYAQRGEPIKLEQPSEKK
jgi:hypothetical protein